MIWFTNFTPKDDDVFVGEPKIVKVDTDSFAIIYSVQDNKKSYMEYKLVNETGKVIASKRFNNLFAPTAATPIVKDKRILWVSQFFSSIPQMDIFGESENAPIFFSDGKVFAFELDVKDPKNPIRVEGIAPKSIVFESDSATLSPGDACKVPYTVLPKETTFDAVKLTSGNTGTLLQTSDGWFTAVRGNATENAFVTSAYDPYLYNTFAIKITKMPKETIISMPTAIYSNAEKGKYSCNYSYYPIQLGKIAWDVRLLDTKTSAIDEYTATSSNPAVAKVEEGSLIRGVGIGKSTITMTSSDKSVTVTCVVEVFPKINATKGLSVTSLPTKTSYKYGDLFDPSGFEATFYLDGSKIHKINDKQVWFYISNNWKPTQIDIWGRNRPLTVKNGKQKVTVQWGSYTTSFNINVGTSGSDNGTAGTDVATDNLLEGTYRLKPVKDTSKCLDISNADKSDGGKLILYRKSGDDNQKFKFIKIGDMEYTITAVHSGKTITSSGVKGKQLTQSSTSGQDNQTFTFVYQGDGKYRIKDSKGFYLGVSGASMKNGSNIILWTLASDDSQLFKLELLK